MAYRIDPNEISRDIKSNLIEDFKNQSESVQKSIQLIQSEYGCCAVDGWKDYQNLENVPNSCCAKFDEQTEKPNATGKCTADRLNDKVGCKTKLQELIKENFKYIYIAIGCVFAFQLLVVVLSCALSKNIREQYNVV